VGDERLVPLRYEYSTLDSVDRAPTTEYDAIRIRVLADDPDTVPDQVETWQDVNDGRDGGEHILIAIDVPETTLDRIRNVIGMGQVLEAETESHDELEREQRTDKRRLESSVSDLLKNAAVHTVHDYRGERPSVPRGRRRRPGPGRLRFDAEGTFATARRSRRREGAGEILPGKW